MTRLSIDGGDPVRERPLPYGRQFLSEEDIAVVVEALRSDWLTTGPSVDSFEKAFAESAGSREAVAVASGTAALHAATFALRIKPGDEVIVPAMTFAASANCVVFQGGTPVFADVDPGSLLIGPGEIAARVTPRTRAIIAVDYAGQPCDYDTLLATASELDLPVIADAAHSMGGRYKGRRVGSLADLNTFSLHPVKHITTGEGGVITTDDPEQARRMRTFRNHGFNVDHHTRDKQGSWFYEMTDLGYNYRLTDFQCALGTSQLRTLSERVARRQAIALRYDESLADMPAVTRLELSDDASHARHIYVILLNLERLKVDRAAVFAALRAEGIGVSVHYIPVHLHPFYRRRFGVRAGLCPVAEAAYERMLTLPMFPQMSDADADDVITALERVLGVYQN